LTVKRTGKGNSRLINLSFTLAFFLFISFLPGAQAQNTAGGLSFPVIERMDSRDTGFRQYINDVEGNRRRLASVARVRPEDLAEHLTVYQYTARPGDDLLSVAARCNIPYSAIASLNRLNNPGSLAAGRVLLLPSCPGIFIPSNLESDLERLIGAARAAGEQSVELRISSAGRNEHFLFFPGADFTSTERAFFLNSGFFRFPLLSYRVTSRYGARTNPVTGHTGVHQGLDLAAPEGTEVYAVAEGTVTGLGEDPVYGNYVIISHRDNWTSLYGHLQRFEVTLRSTVRSGTLIGRVGTTGQSTGPHLHFELRQGGRAVDPSGRLRP
jgi:murein DD-endopeptidase MepM/ murein hydrolase activator NlpD